MLLVQGYRALDRVARRRLLALCGLWLPPCIAAMVQWSGIGLLAQLPLVAGGSSRRVAGGGPGASPPALALGRGGGLLVVAISSIVAPQHRSPPPVRRCPRRSPPTSSRRVPWMTRCWCRVLYQGPSDRVLPRSAAGAGTARSVGPRNRASRLLPRTSNWGSQHPCRSREGASAWPTLWSWSMPTLGPGEPYYLVYSRPSRHDPRRRTAGDAQRQGWTGTREELRGHGRVPGSARRVTGTSRAL